MWNTKTFVIAIYKPRVVVFQKNKNKINIYRGKKENFSEKLFVFATMTF